MSYILLWLEAPLQSWGYNSRFWNRDCLPFPTKSGVYGLLLSAMGRRGPQGDLLEALSHCKQEVRSYIRDGYGQDSELPLLSDFHMVGSGYDATDTWEKMQIPKKSDGSSAVGGGSKLTYRYYIQDGRFAVIQEIPENIVDEVVEALQFPVFDISLGRKNCPPSDFVFRGLYQQTEDALQEADRIASEKSPSSENKKSRRLIHNFTVKEENSPDKGDIYILNDVPIQFGLQKLYRDRVVTLIKNNYKE